MPQILIVDDIEDNITLLSFNLEDDGHQVISANSGEECLQKAGEHRPDLILLDIIMPGINGLETLRRLKASPELQDIPIIMVSATDEDDAIIEALDMGAHDYITKPFVFPILAARMRSALRLQESQHQLQSANTQLARLASLDPLTEIYNRRHFLKLANAEFAKAKRYQRPLSLIMLDVDHFKTVNDNFGHACGDRALIALTRLCQSMGRDSEILGRFGGEEFVICCPETDVSGALSFAERLRIAVANSRVPVNNDAPEHTQKTGQTLQFTISLGITSLSRDDRNLDELIRRADMLQYKAKNSGRNCCVCDGD